MSLIPTGGKPQKTSLFEFKTLHRTVLQEADVQPLHSTLAIEKVEKKSSYKSLETLNNVSLASIFMIMPWLFLLNPRN